MTFDALERLMGLKTMELLRGNKLRPSSPIKMPTQSSAHLHQNVFYSMFVFQ